MNSWFVKLIENDFSKNDDKIHPGTPIDSPLVRTAHTSQSWGLHMILNECNCEM